MATRFSPKLKLSTVLITSAMVLAGCASDVATYSTVKPLYRAHGDFAGVSAQSYYEKGKRYFADKRYGLALDAFQSELRLNSKSVNALNGIAACYDKLNRYDVAVSYYYKALRLAPESPRILSNLGYSFLLQGRDADAIKVLSLALKKDPDNAFARHNLVLAKSHGWNIDEEQETTPNQVASALGDVATEKPVIPAATAVVKTSAERENVSEVAAVEPETVKKIQNQVTKHVEPAAQPLQADVVPSQKSTDVVVSEPATMSEVATADSGLFPAIDISSETAEPPQVARVAANASTELAVDEESATPLQLAEATTDVAVSEPATMSEVATADSGLFPAIDISSEAAEPPQAARVATKMTTELAVDEEPATRLQATEATTDVAAIESASTIELAGADNDLFPAIDISSEARGHVESIAESPRVDVVTAETVTDLTVSEPESVTKIAAAESGLLPASEIISELTVQDAAVTVQADKEVDTSVQKAPGITTIDVDAALSEVNVITDIETVSIHDSDEYSIEVSNGNGWNGMARLLGKHLKSKGGHVVRLTNADTFSYTNTIIYYGNGLREQAEQLASQFPIKVQLAHTSENRQDIDVRVVLGKDVVAHAPDVRRSLYAWDMNDVINPISASVEISNGNGRDGMARLLRSVMVSHGDVIRRVTNADNFDYQETVIYFAKGRREDARQLAAKLPVKATLKETRENRSDIDVRIVLGKDFLNYEVAMRQFIDANA